MQQLKFIYSFLSPELLKDYLVILGFLKRSYHFSFFLIEENSYEKIIYVFVNMKINSVKNITKTINDKF